MHLYYVNIIIIIIGLCHEGLFRLHVYRSHHLHLCQLTFYPGWSILIPQIGDACIIRS
jgi:hypothetical protein